MVAVLDAVTQRTLYAIRENLAATLSGVQRGAASTTRHVVINARGEVLGDRSGTWSVDLENSLEVNAGFDPVLVGGVSVVSEGAAREMILARLKGELEYLSGNLFALFD